MSSYSENLKVIRVFIASPNDLNTEREIFTEVVQEVNEIKGKPLGILFEPIGWENTLPGRGRPQELINNDLLSCNLIVMLLWKRWGTTTRKYSSGFEEEYFLALNNNKEIWLYFKDIPDDNLKNPDDQLNKILEFRDNIESQKELLYSRFENEIDWQKLIRNNLCLWLDTLPNKINKIEKANKNLESEYKVVKKELESLKSEKYKIINELAKQASEYENLGRVTKAEEYYVRAIELDQNPNVINMYTVLLIKIGSYSKAKDNLLKLIQIGNQCNDKNILVSAYTNMGILYYNIDQTNNSRQMYYEALKICEEISNENLKAIIYINLGNLVNKLGEIDQSEYYYKKSLSIVEEMGETKDLSTIYGNLGTIYGLKGEMNNAENMYKKALDIDKKINYKDGMANDYGNLGNLYRTKGEYMLAEEMYNNSLSICIELGLNEGISDNFCSLGVLYQNIGELKKAEGMHFKSISIAKDIQNKDGLIDNYLNLAILYQKSKDYKSAEGMYKKAIPLLEELGYKEKLAGLYNNLAQLYIVYFDFKNAELILKKAMLLNEKLSRIEGLAINYVNLGHINKFFQNINLAKEYYLKAINNFTIIGNNEKINEIKSFISNLPPVSPARL